MIAPLVGLKTEQASIGQSQIGAAAAYIAGRYDNRIGLVSESEDKGLNVVNDTPCNRTFWIYDDNLWASQALKPFYPQIAENISVSLSRFIDKYGNSQLFEVVLGMEIPTPIHDHSWLKVANYTLDGLNYTVLADRHRPEDGGTFYDADQYADLCFYLSLNYYLQLNTVASEKWFRTGEAFWNGHGFFDKAANASAPQNASKRYQNYKLGLYLFTAKATGFNSSIYDAVEKTAWSYQEGNGGIASQSYLNGTIYGTANVETTSILLLAYNEEAIARFPNTLQIGVYTQAWSMFRHDNMRTGCAEGFVPLTNYTLWTYNHPGAWIVTSPVIADGRVIIGDEYLDTSNPTPHVYALNETTGELLWNCSVSGWPWTPTLSDARVLFGTTDGYAYSLDATTGTIIWNKNLGDAIDSSPAVLDGVIYLGTLDGGLFALNQTNGETIWFQDLGYQCALSPAVTNGTVIVEAMQTPGVTLWALNKSSGMPEWSFNYTSDLWFPGWWQQVPLISPAVYDGKVYTGGDGFYCLNATSGEVLWQNNTVQVSCSPTAYEDTIFIGGNSSLFAFKQDTGALIWQYQLNDSYDAVYSSPAVGSGIVCLTSYGGSSGSGDSYIHTLNTTDGRQIWYYDTADKETMISPAIANGKLFVPTPHRLFAFGDNTPPTIGAPSHRPETVPPYQNVTVSVNASDSESGLESITLYYSTDNRTSWKEPAQMHYNASTAVFEAVIPGQPANTWVDYKIVAYDQAGNWAILDGTEPYRAYQVTPEFALSIAPIVLIIVISSVLILIKKYRSLKTAFARATSHSYLNFE